MPLPITTILLVFAVTISITEDTILYGLAFFVLALLYEIGRAVAARSDVGPQTPTTQL